MYNEVPVSKQQRPVSHAVHKPKQNARPPIVESFSQTHTYVEYRGKNGNECVQTLGRQKGEEERKASMLEFLV